MTLEHRPVIAGRVARARRRLGCQSRRLTGYRLRHVVSSDRCHGSSVDTPLDLLRMLMFSAICLLVWAAAFSSLSAQQPAPGRPEATSLAGVPLYIPRLPNVDKLAADLDAAQKTLAANPNDPGAVIWVGRRYGYLWRFQDSIATFTRGIERWPNNAKFYRHRGHRYITIRQFAKAEADLAKAAELVRGTPDEIEPDGAPNPSGQPRSTLQFNIWYHLGLARYLQENYEGALQAYVECMKVSTNDDSVTATSDWMWMTLMRLNRRADAARVLDRITPAMEILENQSYHRRLLMYKGVEKAEALLDTEKADDTTIATQGYGVGNYYFVTGDRQKARDVFKRIVAGAGWNAFGFIAAEADLLRGRF